MPSWDFLKSAPQTEALRIESEPAGADAKASSGQECRTPCELTVPSAAELSVTLSLNGYQPQTISVRPEAPGAGGGAGHLAPNPIYAELTATAPTAPPKKHIKRKKPVAAAHPAAPATTATASAPTTTASAPPAAASSPPPPMPAVPAPESAASATNYPWPTR